jgi:hypothetical protein
MHRAARRTTLGYERELNGDLTDLYERFAAARDNAQNEGSQGARISGRMNVGRRCGWVFGTACRRTGEETHADR